jgi:hypothetical protein
MSTDRREEDTDADEVEGTTSLPARQPPEDRQEVRGGDAQERKAPEEGEAQAQLTMTVPEWDTLAAYVTRLRDDLLLGHWRIELEHLPPKPTEPDQDVELIDGQIESLREGYTAKLRVHANFRQGTPDDQRETIIHELLHLHFDQLFSDMTDLIEGFAAKQAFEACDVLNRRNYERMTAAVAAAISPKFPLIEWG